MRAGLRLAQLELDPPPDDVAAEVDEVLEDLEQRQHARAAADDRERDDAEGLLQLRVLVEVVEDDLADLAALQLDHDAHAVAVRFVADVGDPFDDLVADEIRDPLLQLCLVDLIGNLGDDDLTAIALLHRLDLGLGANLDGAAAGQVGLTHALTADNQAAGRKVRTGNALDQAAQLLFLGQPRRGLGFGHTFRHVVVFDQPHDALDHLAQVVRRDVGRHAHRDAGGAVDQQIRKRRRKDRRFGGGFVEVRDVVDGVLVEVRHHHFGECLESGLGVAVGRGRVAVDRPEVALAVDQGVAHVEVLRETDQRVVGRNVAVRVVVADHLADDLRALAIGAVRRQPHLPHRVEHASMRGLEPVAHVGQRAPDDHAHRVIEIRAAHLVFDVDGNSLFGAHVVSDKALSVSSYQFPVQSSSQCHCQHHGL